MLCGRGLLRERARARVLESLVDLGGDLPSDGFELRAVDTLGDEPGLEALERTAGAPLLVLIDGPIAEVVVEVRSAVLAPAVGRQLEEDGALPRAGLVDGPLGDLGDLAHVVAVAAAGSDAVTGGDVGDGAVGGLAGSERRVDGVQVVLADEDHGQAAKRGEVDRFVKNAFLDRALAEE